MKSTAITAKKSTTLNRIAKRMKSQNNVEKQITTLTGFRRKVLIGKAG